MKVDLRKEARRRKCQIRIPGYCSRNTEESVLCHLNIGGMGEKAHDLHGAIGCSSCHDVVDHRMKTSWTWPDIKLMFYEGVIRTQKIWLDEGFIHLEK